MCSGCPHHVLNQAAQHAAEGSDGGAALLLLHLAVVEPEHAGQQRLRLAPRGLHGAPDLRRAGRQAVAATMGSSGKERGLPCKLKAALQACTGSR